MKNIVAIIVMCLISGLTVCQDQQKLDSLLTLFEKEKNDSIKVVLLLSAGDIFESAEPEKALNFYEQALNYADEKKLDELKTKALRYIRIVHRDEGNWAGMWKWCSAGIVHAKKTGNMAETAVIYSDIGIKHDEMGNPDSSLFYYNRSLKIYLDLLKQDPENKVAIKGLAYGYNNIGMIYWQLGKTDNALEMYDKGIENSRKIGNIYSLTNQMLNKGKLYSQQGDYDKAMEMYEQSFNENVDFLKKCTGKQDSTNAQEGIGKSLSCMSYVYNYTGEYEKALEKLDLAVQKLKKGNKSHLGSCYFSIGQVYCNMGDYPGAIQNILHAVELFETARDVSNLAIALG
ncbi:MAG: tetratricopeptide repeat protein, partial [Bacteroidota bacterium]